MPALGWLSGSLALAAAVCLYLSVTYVSGTGGFFDPKTGRTFEHVRVDRRLMAAGLVLGVLSSLL